MTRENDMPDKVIIYGKIGCPFTDRARKAYGENAVFYDVKSDPEKLAEMLALSGGERRVPVIFENGEARVGYKGA